jgi:hypothetical protein
MAMVHVRVHMALALAIRDATHTASRAASFFGEGSVPNRALAGPGRPENLANSLAVTLSLNCNHH